jgi:hypothetical protein
MKSVDGPPVKSKGQFRYSDLLEVLYNLNYLTQQCADDPEEVRNFAKQSEEQLIILDRLVRAAAVETLGVPN